MFFVYILYSLKKDGFYIGYTGFDLSERVRKHNSNHNGFTGGIGDWALVYSEPFSSKQEVQTREKETKILLLTELRNNVYLFFLIERC